MEIKIDKKLHLAIGILIAIVVGLFCGSIIGLAISIIIGAAKEIIWDKFLGRGHVEFADFAYTSIGGIIGFVILLIFNLIL